MSIKIALAGNPNCGKTTLFNDLTGSNQYVGNWPGVTVEKKEGRLKGQKDVVIQDLPGIYSLSPYTLEEVVARGYLVNEKPDAILNIIDGTNIERNLYLTTQLIELGIPVVMAVNMIGTLTGKQAEAASIVESMQETFDEIKANAGDGTKTVYFEVSPLQYGLWTAGSGTFMDEIANMLGLTNCFADVTGWGEISEEQVLERNPDYIVTISMYYGEGPTPEEEILSRTGWENVTAVKDGKILNLQNNELSRPGPRLADGAKAMYDFVYGE